MLNPKSSIRFHEDLFQMYFRLLNDPWRAMAIEFGQECSDKNDEDLWKTDTFTLLYTFGGLMNYLG